LLHSAEGRFLTGIHVLLGVAVLASNALAAAWGAVAWLRGIPSTVFWYVLRFAQATVVAEVVVGLVLLAQGDTPPDDLHYLYGIAPLVVTLVTEAMRAGASRAELELVDDPDALPRRERILLARRIVLREIGIMTIGLLLVVTLLLRALSSGGFVSFL
jgi:hypothetical protein